MKYLVSIFFSFSLLLSACDSGVSVEPDEAFETQAEQMLKLTPDSPSQGVIKENKGKMPIAGSATGSGHFFWTPNADIEPHWRTFTINAIQTVGNEARGSFQLGHHNQRVKSLRGGNPVGTLRGSVECAVFVSDQADIVGTFDNGTPFYVYMIDGKHAGNADLLTLVYYMPWVRDWGHDAVCSGDRPSQQIPALSAGLKEIEAGNITVRDYTDPN